MNFHHFNPRRILFNYEIICNPIMDTINISEDRFKKVLADVEVLLEDVTALINRDDIVRQRTAEIKADPSIGKTEKELDEYLKEREVKID